MINLETFRKMFPFLILIVVIGLLIIGYFIFTSVNQAGLPRIPVSDLGIEENPDFRAQKINYAEVILKKETQTSAAVFKSTDKVESLTQTSAVKVARSFGFTAKPKKSSSVFIWSKNRDNFIANTQDNNLALSKDTAREKPVAIKSFPSKEKVDVVAKDTLKKIGIDQTNINFDKAAVSYSANEGLDGSVNTSGPGNNVRVMIVDYQLKIDDTALYDQIPPPLNFQVKVNQKGKLVGFKAPWYPYFWSKLANYPLKGIDASIKNLEEGGGAIVSLNSVRPGKEKTDKKNILAVSITDVTLGYYSKTGEPNVLIPIYIFRGEAAFSSRERANVTFYDIAVSDKHLIK